MQYTSRRSSLWWALGRCETCQNILLYFCIVQCCIILYSVISYCQSIMQYTGRSSLWWALGLVRHVRIFCRSVTEVQPDPFLILPFPNSTSKRTCPLEIHVKSTNSYSQFFCLHILNWRPQIGGIEVPHGTGCENRKSHSKRTEQPNYQFRNKDLQQSMGLFSSFHTLSVPPHLFATQMGLTEFSPPIPSHIWIGLGYHTPPAPAATKLGLLYIKCCNKKQKCCAVCSSQVCGHFQHS